MRKQRDSRFNSLPAFQQKCTGLDKDVEISTGTPSKSECSFCGTNQQKMHAECPRNPMGNAEAI